MLDYDTGHRYYTSAASSYQANAAQVNADCSRIADCSRALNRQRAAADEANKTRLDLEQRREEIKAALRRFEQLDHSFSSAQSAAGAAGLAYSGAIAMRTVAPAALEQVFRSPAVSADNATSAALQASRAELARIEQAIEYIRSVIRQAEQQIQQYSAAIARLNRNIAACQAQMRSSAVTMDYYSAYRSYAVYSSIYG